MSKTVDVTTDAAVHPKLTLTMKGKIEVLAAFEPSVIDFGRLTPGTTKTQTVRVDAKDPAALRLTNVKVSDPDMLKAEVVQDGGTVGVKVTLTVTKTEGSAGGKVTVATNVAGVPELTLQVRAKIGGDLEVTPSTAVLSPFEKGQPPPEFTLRVTSVSGKPFHLLKVEDPTGTFGGSVAPQGSGWLIRLVARKAPKTTSGQVFVVTDRKDQARLAIPYLVSDPALTAAKLGRRPDGSLAPPTKGQVRAVAPVPASRPAAPRSPATPGR